MPSIDAIGMVARDLPATLAFYRALGLAIPAESDALVERLRGLGHAVQREPWDAAWGQRYATVVDPVGSGVDLYAAL
ncbi:hypothetical protein LG314_04350 [Agrococcus terreus]|uniref:hypothetical protein n=1 Tax=Agrococcus terreus TaxID=574649 RepID=UPI00384AE035